MTERNQSMYTTSSLTAVTPYRNTDVVVGVLNLNVKTVVVRFWRLFLLDSCYLDTLFPNQKLH